MQKGKCVSATRAADGGCRRAVGRPLFALSCIPCSFSRQAVWRGAGRLHWIYWITQLSWGLPCKHGVHLEYQPTAEAPHPDRGSRNIPAHRRRVWRLPGDEKKLWVWNIHRGISQWATQGSQRHCCLQKLNVAWALLKSRNFFKCQMEKSYSSMLLHSFWWNKGARLWCVRELWEKYC